MEDDIKDKVDEAVDCNKVEDEEYGLFCEEQMVKIMVSGFAHLVNTVPSDETIAWAKEITGGDVNEMNIRHKSLTIYVSSIHHTVHRFWDHEGFEAALDRLATRPEKEFIGQELELLKLYWRRELLSVLPPVVITQVDGRLVEFITSLLDELREDGDGTDDK